MRLKKIVQLVGVTGAAIAPVVADEASETQAKAIEVLRATPTGVAPTLPGQLDAIDSISAYSTARAQREQQHRPGESGGRRRRDRAGLVGH